MDDSKGKKNLPWWTRWRQAVSVPLWFLGLAGIAANVRRWIYGYHFLRDHAPLISSHPIVWTIFSLVSAFVLTFYSQIQEAVRPSISVELVPTLGSSPAMEVRVKNTGKGREFYAQCEFLALRNSPNPLPRITFDLQWAGREDKRLFIANQDTANLLIADFTQDQKTAFAEMTVWGLSGLEKKPYGWAGWSMNSREKLPEYDLGISIRGDGAKVSKQLVFTLRPQKFYGPLEMFKKSVRDIV